jgi:hypothetical protein
MLIINIVAKPLTELSPNINNITAIINVVTFESNIELNEFLIPFL